MSEPESVAGPRLLVQALQHRTTGRSHYHAGRLRETSRALERGCRLAAAAGEEGVHVEDECRFWLGASLHGEGRVQEALSAWTPTVNRAIDGSLTTDRYMALTRYLLVAVDIPLPLAKISAALDEAEGRLRDMAGGFGGPSSRILLTRGRLAACRGSWHESLDLIQEGLARRHHEPLSYSYSVYFKALAKACLRLGELDLMSDYLEEWDATEQQYLPTKRLLISVWRARHALARGEAEDALCGIEGMQSEIAACEDVASRIEAADAFVRSCLAVGEPERARAITATAARARHSPIGEVRFAAKLLVADFRLACAEAAPAAPSPPNDSTVPTLSTGCDMRRARRALAVVRREAEGLDALLECDRHRTEVGERLARLDAADADR